MIRKFIKFWQKILNLPFFLLILSSLMVLSIYVVQTNTEGRVKADDLSPWCDNPPDCCGSIAKSGDPMDCSWPERKYCKPDQCNISEGTNRQRCGVAYKEDWPYGCVGKPPPGVTITPNTTPVFYNEYQTSKPAVNISVTQAPTATIMPTQIPTQPVSVVFPTTVFVPTQVVQFVVSTPVAPTAFSTQAPIYAVATGMPAVIPTAISIPTPIPTVPSSVSVISKQMVDLFQSAKEVISKFFSVVLP